MTTAAAAPASPPVPPQQTPAPAAAQRDKRKLLVDATLKRHHYRQDALIEALHTAQSVYGFLTPETLWYVAQQLKLPPSKVYGVATFYNFFSLKPPGEHTVVICQGTVCYMRNGPKIAAALKAAFGVEVGGTTADGALSLAEARCLGSCGLAPVLVVDGRVIGLVEPQHAVEKVRAALAEAPAAAVEAAA